MHKEILITISSPYGRGASSPNFGASQKISRNSLWQPPPFSIFTLSEIIMFHASNMFSSLVLEL